MLLSFFSPRLSLSLCLSLDSRLLLLLLLLLLHPPPKFGQLAPSRATFFSAVARSGGSSGGRSSSGGNDGGKDGDGDDSDEAKVLPSLAAFSRGFGPVLKEIDEWYTAKGLNDPSQV